MRIRTPPQRLLHHSSIRLRRAIRAAPASRGRHWHPVRVPGRRWPTPARATAQPGTPFSLPLGPLGNGDQITVFSHWAPFKRQTRSGHVERRGTLTFRASRPLGQQADPRSGLPLEGRLPSPVPTLQRPPGTRPARRHRVHRGSAPEPSPWRAFCIWASRVVRLQE